MDITKDQVYGWCIEYGVDGIVTYGDIFRKYITGPLLVGRVSSDTESLRCADLSTVSLILIELLNDGLIIPIKSDTSTPIFGIAYPTEIAQKKLDKQ